MTQFSVLVLATLAGAGITGASLVLNAQVPGDAALGSAGTQTTISSEAATAWQALRRPKQADPVPQEQATVRTDSFRAPMPVPAASPPLHPVSLARALQRELKRAGCYHGEINGIWTPSTRQAMKAYTDIANAKLPVASPDPVLLALIQGDQHLGCTERCLRNGKPDTCREDRVAAPSPLNSKSVTTSEGPTAAFTEPPMALAGPKTPEPDGKISAPQEPAQKARKRQAGPQDRSGDRAARTEHWTVKLWKDSGY
jgi:peptidoglycan hydrolase-like protein with peptidoglycan-binding domain